MTVAGTVLLEFSVDSAPEPRLVGRNATLLRLQYAAW